MRASSSLRGILRRACNLDLTRRERDRRSLCWWAPSRFKDKSTPKRESWEIRAFLRFGLMGNRNINVPIMCLTSEAFKAMAKHGGYRSTPFALLMSTGTGITPVTRLEGAETVPRYTQQHPLCGAMASNEVDRVEICTGFTLELDSDLFKSVFLSILSDRRNDRYLWNYDHDRLLKASPQDPACQLGDTHQSTAWSRRASCSKVLLSLISRFKAIIRPGVEDGYRRIEWQCVSLRLLR